jgi:transcriptional regulator with XRE-family HTH domain
MTAKPQAEGVLFGERLRELREHRGETQRSLADLTGMTHPYISEMERGLKVPSLTTLLRLAVALECDITELVDVFSGRNLKKILPKHR